MKDEAIKNSHYRRTADKIRTLFLSKCKQKCVFQRFPHFKQVKNKTPVTWPQCGWEETKFSVTKPGCMSSSYRGALTQSGSITSNGGVAVPTAEGIGGWGLAGLPLSTRYVLQATEVAEMDRLPLAINFVEDN